MRRAAELDPFSPIVMVGLGWAFFVTGNYDQAITRNRQTLEIFPNSVQAYLHLGMALAEKGMFGQAIEVLEKASSITSGAPPVAAVLAHVRARAGDSRPARLLLEDLKKRKDVTPILFGLLYMDIGDRDRAFEWFNRAVEQRSMFSDEIMVEPMYRPLHSDPRWPALLKKMNLGN